MSPVSHNSSDTDKIKSSEHVFIRVKTVISYIHMNVTY